jgi:hypothetical protein
MAVLKGYFDDSGKADDPQHCVVAYGGYVGTTDAWTKFDPAWQSALDEFGAPYLHMNEFAGSVKGFDGWGDQKEKRKKFLRKLTKVIRDCELEYVAHVVNLRDLLRLNAEFSLSLDAEPLALYLCVLELEQSHPDEEIELIIDKLDKPQRLIDKTRAIAKHESRVDEVGRNVDLRALPKFASFKCVLPIQAADFIAYEALKFNRSRAIVGYETSLPLRKSFEALIRGRRGRGGYWNYKSLLSLHESRGGVWPKTTKGEHAIALRRLAEVLRRAKFPSVSEVVPIV